MHKICIIIYVYTNTNVICCILPIFSGGVFINNEMVDSVTAAGNVVPSAVKCEAASVQNVYVCSDGKYLDQIICQKKPNTLAYVNYGNFTGVVHSKQ